MGKGFMLLTTGVTAIGGFLFGYDVGVIGGCITMTQFLNVFPAIAEDEVLKGFVVASLTIGCLIGALATSYFADRFGRKLSCMGGAAIFTVGALLQTIASSLAVLILGRFIAGLAVGMLSAIVPLYLSEIAPKEKRGALVSAQQLTITIGIVISFFTNFGSDQLEGDLAFRLPFGIQMVFSTFMIIGMVFLPRSPRWLVAQGRVKEAMEVLVRVRDSVSDAQQELDEIQDSIRLEREIGNGSWRELKDNGMWRRVLIGIGLQMFQQLTGINVVMYYSNDVLKSAGFTGRQLTLLSTAVTGIVNVVATLPGMYLIDRAGRRVLLLTGDLVMAASFAVLAALIGVYQPEFSVKAVPWVCLIMMCIFTAGFAYSWGPICWVYPSEIFPLRIRAKAVSLATASNWLFNALIGLLAPLLMKLLGWGFYLVLVGFLAIMGTWVFFKVPETKGKSLEDMDAIFGDKPPASKTVETKDI
ncbi:sugar transporter [Thamnocephalis sphaerospora]|uniref:Sugar transporter n=1 Tax=Thamnocephalis sphaerospora TaxID=78915 RepID=A0A4P9XRB8_9FUNG|nr:sugar transporter [Thamnocephalis sphaerospora]|eukprot:RKP08472.1 sugar transporter [Thamnocephalis sphaerospora]